jgi:hypothetical protein
LLGSFQSTAASQNARETVEGMRVGMTPDELVYIVASHGAGCRCKCQQVGRSIVSVPLKVKSQVFEKSSNFSLFFSPAAHSRRAH